MPRLMTEKETAVMVGMSVHWLRRKRWDGGRIPFVKMSARGVVRYSEETVLQYINTHFRISTSDTGENLKNLERKHNNKSPVNFPECQVLTLKPSIVEIQKLESRPSRNSSAVTHCSTKGYGASANANYLSKVDIQPENQSQLQDAEYDYSTNW